VSGKVLYKGKPLTGGVVTFLPASGGCVNAKIKEDGSYSMAKAPPGKVKVGVVSTSSKPPPSPTVAKMVREMKGKKKREFTQEELDKRPPEFRDALEYSSGPGKVVEIPKKYNDAEKSGLEYEVVGGKEEHDIDLP
jgi:hypothetical protein